MAWAHVQSTSQRAASGGNAKAYATAITAGSTLIVSIGLETDTATISSVTDNNSNTWTAIGSLQSQSGNAAGQLYYAKNANAGATTVTVTPSTGGSHITIHEYSGLDTTAPFDATAAAQGTAAAADSGNASTAGANELVYGYTVANRASTVGSGFTQRINEVFNLYIHAQDKNGDGGNENSTTTQSDGTGGWIAIVAAFKQPGGGGGGSAMAAMHAARQRSSA